VLTTADLEVNVLEFRQRSFQFERLAELPDGPYAVFSRTETENERQLRPKLVRLIVAVPLAWVVLDPNTEVLRVGTAGARPDAPESSPLEVAAEPSESEEGGRRWLRTPLGTAGYVYAPAERAAALLTPEGRSSLGLG
jgi:hypothetical protein